MTKTKRILGVSLAAVFAISLLGSAYASGHLTIESASVTATPTEITKAKIDTTGKIPTKGGFVGYGVVTSSFVMPFPMNGPADVVIATTHAGVLDSELQKGDPMSPKWHNHYAKIGASPLTVCKSGVQVLDISHESPGKVKVKGDKIEIKDVPIVDAPGSIPAHFGLAPNLPTTFTTGTYGGYVASFTLSGSPTSNPVHGVTVCVDGLTPFLAP